MKHRAKFVQKQEQALTQQSQQELTEFTSSDELLRYDAARVDLPPGIAQRLQRSAARAQGQGIRRWWQRLFGRD